MAEFDEYYWRSILKKPDAFIMSCDGRKEEMW